MISKIEKAKSIALISLMLLALFLTQWILYDGLFANHAKDYVVEYSAEKLLTIVRPQSYHISFGGLSYTRVYNQMLQERFWTELRPVVVNAMRHYTSIEDISRDDYLNMFTDLSILMKMPLHLKGETYMALWEVETTGDTLEGIYFSEILMRSGSNHSMFIYDQPNERYYRVRTEDRLHDVEAIIAAIPDEDIIEYRKISHRFSLENTVSEDYNQANYELIPFQYNYLVPQFTVGREELFESDVFSSGAQGLIQTVFGDRMDFVKRMRDVNGALILMYGYGERTLRFESSGKVVFNQKFVPSLSKELHFMEALNLAVGRLEHFGVYPEALFLADYETITDTDKGYIFYFNYKVMNYAMAKEGKSDYPVKVFVKGNQVIQVDKNVVVPETLITIQETDQLLSIDECISRNFLQMSVYYLQDKNIFTGDVNVNDYYFIIRSEIEAIDITYYKLEGYFDDVELLIPCWQVQIAGRVYLFDAYKGTLLKTFSLLG